MSQYTISINSIINIKSHLPPYNDIVFNNIPEKIKRGQEIFFNFDYLGNAEFKNLFERAFLLKYLNRDICFDDIDIFMIYLENEIQIKSKIYYPQYKLISDEIDEYKKKIGVIENKGENSTKGKNTTLNKNKSLSSQFPQDIKNANEFENVSHMDSGGFSTGSGEASSEAYGTMSNESIEYNSKLSKSFEYIELKQKNIIEDFINSLSSLFMGVF